ncbi:hypothetical protein ABZX97_08840 [Streptomyces seoulensis]|uniref:hypothetical protein n=1 Tax=Streptomyces seoulensis TaxID=73044 RepID=UPI0033AB4EF9
MAAIVTASADAGTAAAWAAPTVGLLAIGWGVKTWHDTKQEQKRAEARSKVSELLEIVDGCEERAVTPTEITSIRRFRRPFERLSKVHRKVREIARVTTAIAGVVDIPTPGPATDQTLYQQQLGEATGRLKEALEAAYEVLSA